VRAADAIRIVKIGHPPDPHADAVARPSPTTTTRAVFCVA
jgi:hypothetical protein